MKILDTGIQLNFGEEVEVAGKVHIAVRDEENQTWGCRLCSLYETSACGYFACSALTRDDGERIHFEVVKE